MKKHLTIAALALILMPTGLVTHAQEPGETDASVPALSAFHKVIYNIWHEAWPNKDVAMLRSLQQDVDKGIAAVASAQLPGILRDKKTAWEEGVRQLQAAGVAYGTAVAAKDDTKLMAAAEELHSRFEYLMRAIRPPMEEVEAFHTVLYRLYHHYLSKFDRAQIEKAAAELEQKMEVLNRAVLPARIKDKDPEFQSKRGQLSRSVAALAPVVQSGDENAIKAAVEKIHSDYQALEHIF